MRVFHRFVFDEVFEGATGAEILFTSPDLDRLLGSVATLSVVMLAEEVAGAATQVFVAYHESPDQIAWTERLPRVINLSAIPAGVVTTLKGHATAENPPSAYGRLRVQVSGANRKARIRLWATGRAGAAQSAAPPDAAPFIALGHRGRVGERAVLD